jgi:hypothetical protein
MREMASQQLLDSLLTFIEQVAGVTDKAMHAKASLAAVLIKKQYLDDREEEKGLWKLNQEHIETLKTRVSNTINFTTQTKLLLQRKADLICKCCMKLNSFDKIVVNLANLLKNTESTLEVSVKQKQFAIYNFNILTQYYLPQDIMVSSAE